MNATLAVRPIRTMLALISLTLLCLTFAGCHPPAAEQTGPEGPPSGSQPDGNPQPSTTANPVNGPSRGAGESAAKNSRPLRVPAGGDLPPLPRAADVIEIVLRMRPSGTEGPLVSLSVSDPTRIDTFLGQLGRIDWKQKGEPLEQISLFAPDIELAVYEKSGIHRDYALYWEEDSFVDNVTNRLLDADVKHLRLLVIEALIREFAAEQAKPAPPAEGAARLDTTSDKALAASLARMTATLSPQQRDDVRQVLEWYENPYSNPNFDGAVTDTAWLDLPRRKKLAPFDGLALAPLLQKLAAEAPASGQGTKPWDRLSPLLSDVASP